MDCVRIVIDYTFPTKSRALLFSVFPGPGDPAYSRSREGWQESGLGLSLAPSLSLYMGHATPLNLSFPTCLMQDASEGLMR